MMTTSLSMKFNGTRKNSNTLENWNNDFFQKCGTKNNNKKPLLINYPLFEKNDAIVVDDSQLGDCSSTISYQSAPSNYPKDKSYIATNNPKKRSNKKSSSQVTTLQR